MRILTITLNIPLHPGLIPNFRSCIIELVGREHQLFHNHDGEHHYHYGYPLVQYAVRRGYACLIGLGAGADALQQILLPRLSGSLEIAGQTHHLTLNDLHMDDQQHAWKVLDNPRQYGLFGWLALNADNYKKWKSTTLTEARKEILNQALTGHLRVAAEAAGITEKETVIGQVLQIDNQKRVHFHHTQMVRFHVMITSSLLLPTGPGIGRSAAFGFGELMPVQKYQRVIQRLPKTSALES